jgi:hypothetical protein
MNGVSRRIDRRLRKCESVDIERLWAYRCLLLYMPTAGEAKAVKSISEQLRLRRLDARLSRFEFAECLDCDVELLAIVENGFGDLNTAKELLAKTN